MIFLDATTKKLQVVLAGAIATLNPCFVASYMDIGTTITPIETDGLCNGTTPVDLITAPSGTDKRQVKWFSIYNQDTAAVTVSVLYNNNGTTRILHKVNLQIGEVLLYNDGEGFVSLDANGITKSCITPGRYIKRTIYTTGSAATHTFTSGCGSAIIEGLACGGGGGGCSYGASAQAYGGGGAAGGYFNVRVQAPTTCTYTVSATGGSAGANTGGTGGTGADAVVVCNGTTYTAKGGLGGVGMTTGSTLICVAGGDGVAGTNGDINTPGTSGGMGVRLSGTTGGSGQGGGSQYGHGGASKTANSAGDPGAGYGAGGGGGAAVSAAVTGGAGAPGIVIITEYS